MTFPPVRFHLLGVLLLLAAAAPDAAAQIDSGTPECEATTYYEQLLERSHILYAFPPSELNLTFEAQVAPNFILFQNVDRRLCAQRDAFYGEARTSVHAFSASITPMVRFRMFADPSFPVRTPSYMPRATLQYLNYRRLSGEAGISFKHPIRMWAANLIVSHYSNGQEGCFFNEQERVDGTCEPAVTDDPVGLTVNRSSGSFSTNFVRAEVAYKRIWTRDVPGETWRAPGRSLLVGVGGELHTTLAPGGLIDALEDRKFATERVQLFAKYEDYRTWLGQGYWWIKGFGEAMSEHPDDVWPVRASVEAAFTFERFADLGIFARWYGGQDYYNLAFVDNLAVVQVGILFRTGKQTRLKLYPGSGL